MNTNSRPWYYSTWIIVLAFIFFWPLGVFLLIMRSAGNKQSLFLGSTDRKKYIIGGACLILIGIMWMSSGSAGRGFFMIVGGIVVIAYSDKSRKKAVRNRQYIDIIVNQGQTSLDNIANMCNINYDVVLKELRTLITLGVLKNAVIDEAARTITIQQAAPQIPQQNLQQTLSGLVDSVTGAVGAQASESAQMVACTCPGCGAKVAIRKGTTQVCDYCDSPIVAN